MDFSKLVYVLKREVQEFCREHNRTDTVLRFSGMQKNCSECMKLDFCSIYNEQQTTCRASTKEHCTLFLCPEQDIFEEHLSACTRVDSQQISHGVHVGVLALAISQLGVLQSH